MALDQGDELLVERLRRELVGSGLSTAFGESDGRETGKGDDGDDGAGDVESAFLAAMQAYREAKRSGDDASTAAAEEALRGVVRAEMAADEPPCGPLRGPSRAM